MNDSKFKLQTVKYNYHFTSK